MTRVTPCVIAPFGGVSHTGTEAASAGRQAGPERGHLKLRVHDTKYDDNSGAYEVNVLVIPKGVVPGATRMTEE